jgi:hypothetical protein
MEVKFEIEQVDGKPSGVKVMDGKGNVLARIGVEDDHSIGIASERFLGAGTKAGAFTKSFEFHNVEPPTVVISFQE